jgi:hypothetical protein
MFLVILYEISGKGTHTLFTNEEIFLQLFRLFFILTKGHSKCLLNVA